MDGNVWRKNKITQGKRGNAKTKLIIELKTHDGGQLLFSRDHVRHLITSSQSHSSRRVVANDNGLLTTKALWLFNFILSLFFFGLDYVAFQILNAPEEAVSFPVETHGFCLRAEDREERRERERDIKEITALRYRAAQSLVSLNKM